MSSTLDLLLPNEWVIQIEYRQYAHNYAKVYCCCINLVATGVYVTVLESILELFQRPPQQWRLQISSNHMETYGCASMHDLDGQIKIKHQTFRPQGG